MKKDENKQKEAGIGPVFKIGGREVWVIFGFG